MAYVIAAPEMMTSAATNVATIGSNVSEAHMVAAAGTTSVIPAAADEVSASIAQLFSQHAANYQALAGQAAGFQEQFVQNLKTSAGAYASVAAAIASFLQSLQSLNVSADALVSAVASWTTQQWLDNIAFVLLSPVEIPAAIGLLLLLYYFLVYLPAHGVPFG